VWRRYARRCLLPPSNGPIRVALRTPLSSERYIRNFTIPNDGSTLPLFVFAQTLLIPSTDSPESDPESPPKGFIPPWHFRIVTNYPRKEIDLIEGGHSGGQAVWEEVRKAGGALFVESKEGCKWGEREKKEMTGEESSDEEEVEA
jgi:FAS-associated factor 2